MPDSVLGQNSTNKIFDDYEITVSCLVEKIEKRFYRPFCDYIWHGDGIKMM